jgi:hypothetical protein
MTVYFRKKATYRVMNNKFVKSFAFIFFLLIPFFPAFPQKITYKEFSKEIIKPNQTTEQKRALFERYWNEQLKLSRIEEYSIENMEEIKSILEYIWLTGTAETLEAVSIKKDLANSYWLSERIEEVFVAQAILSQVYSKIQGRSSGELLQQLKYVEARWNMQYRRQKTKN